MKIVVVILPRFQEAGMRIAKFLEAESLPYSESVFTELYGKCDVIICIMSAGIAVRGCAPLLTDKWHDPAIVVVTICGTPFPFSAVIMEETKLRSVSPILGSNRSFQPRQR